MKKRFVCIGGVAKHESPTDHHVRRQEAERPQRKRLVDWQEGEAPRAKRLRPRHPWVRRGRRLYDH